MKRSNIEKIKGESSNFGGGNYVFIIRYDELSELLSDPEVIGDTKRFMELTKKKQHDQSKTRSNVINRWLKKLADTEEMLGESQM